MRMVVGSIQHVHVHGRCLRSMKSWHRTIGTQRGAKGCVLAEICTVRMMCVIYLWRQNGVVSDIGGQVQNKRRQTRAYSSILTSDEGNVPFAPVRWPASGLGTRLLEAPENNNSILSKVKKYEEVYPHLLALPQKKGNGLLNGYTEIFLDTIEHKSITLRSPRYVCVCVFCFRASHTIILGKHDWKLRGETPVTFSHQHAHSHMIMTRPRSTKACCICIIAKNTRYTVHRGVFGRPSRVTVHLAKAPRVT